MRILDYETKTTFWDDFAIAEKFGEKAIRDTYKSACKGWRDNTEYITELTMVLNWRLWRAYEEGDELIAKVYDELWRDSHNWCLKNLKGDDLSYYIRTTD